MNSLLHLLRMRLTNYLTHVKAKGHAFLSCIPDLLLMLNHKQTEAVSQPTNLANQHIAQMYRKATVSDAKGSENTRTLEEETEIGRE